MKSVKSVIVLSANELETLKLVCTSEQSLEDGSKCLGAWGEPTEPEVVSLLKWGFITTEDTEVDDDNQMFYYPTEYGLNYWNEHSIEKDLPKMNDFVANEETEVEDKATRKPRELHVETIDLDFDELEASKFVRKSSGPTGPRKSVLKDAFELEKLEVGKARFIPAKAEHLLAENAMKHPARAYATFVAKYNATCVPNNVKQAVDEHGKPIHFTRTSKKTGITTIHPKIEYVHREYKIAPVQPGYNGSKHGGAVIYRVK
ncbi:unnamed protein product [Sphagnum tenellum]